MPHHIETDLTKIKHLANIRNDENFRFRTFLKGKDGAIVDKIVHRLHQEITAQIDCTQCGNCCQNLRPGISTKDIEKFALSECITSEEYKERYCEKEDGITYLKDIPCRYLNGKICSIYDERPDECRSYPNTHKNGFISRTWRMIDNYGICPIVFNVMEGLKYELRFRR
ncbi:Fe-S oxidoreductase [Bacteroidia bacterium]|nr:Fe-S oxidoreductase [Bacteroidia bacterium]GHT47103.1 Fe-S oxidoreductase [Bacteroidia bacterium]